MALPIISAICASSDVISACEALKQRASLNHKVIYVRGIQIATEEGAWLEASDCAVSLTIGGQPCRALIWLEMGGRQRNAAGFGSVDLRASVKKVNEELVKRGYTPERDTLQLTYIGYFETTDESAQGSDGGPAKIGFGHMNAAPVQLIVRDVRDPAVAHKK